MFYGMRLMGARHRSVYFWDTHQLDLIVACARAVKSQRPETALR